MIKFIDSKLVKQEIITVDDYITFDVKFVDTIKYAPHLWWFYRGWGGDLILEFSFNRVTRVTHEISLVSIPKKYITFRANLSLQDVPINEGLPVCDFTPWVSCGKELKDFDHQDYYVEETATAISLVYGRDMLSLYLEGSPDNIVSYYKNGQVHFGVNEDSELISIELTDLTEEEIHQSMIASHLLKTEYEKACEAGLLARLKYWWKHR